MRSRWTSALLVALVAVLVLPWRAAPPPVPGAEPFAGTDTQVVDVLTDHGVEPWFTPVFAPASSEVEAGLFALQAAVGAGVLGFALGRLSGRATARAEAADPRGDADG